MTKELSAEEAWAGYLKHTDAFKAAGIPWNQKGSPHRLLLKAKWYVRQIPFSKIISFTFQQHAPQIAANISANNALLTRLTKK